MNELIGFLRARLVEDERSAKACAGAPWAVEIPPMVHVSVEARRDEKWRLGRLGYVATVERDEDREHIARHPPKRVLAEVAIDRELLRDYERLLRAHEQHKAAVAELDADLEHEARTGKWEGFGLPDVRQQALRREADYLPAQLRTLEGWARGKASVYSDHPDYREEWRP
ncbi:DUF6221 family protein [Streptomyces synnematoformans]|uniref:Uncharacterized protein n=1 Tax=Streptomyces synnematoformans TaxID=415721 RepID=A0ABN2XAV1_9ACTN